MSPNSKALQTGRDFEFIVCEALGLELTAASGNQWTDRGDARGRGLRPSMKSNPTTRRSWSNTRSELAEAIEIAQGTGQLPLLAVEDQDGARIVLMRLEDLAELIGQGQTSVKAPRRAERIRAAASTPLMMRKGS